jgi:preprotein translocase subunit YajC
MKRLAWMWGIGSQLALAEGASAQPSMIESVIPFLFIFVAMYFILIRPQAKKAKEQAAFLQNLKTGDEVFTTGGMLGRVRNVAPDFVTVEAGGVNLKFLREHIQRLAQAPGVAEKK